MKTPCLAAAAWLWMAASAGAIDLAERYPATLDYSESMPGYEWTCGEEDVWRLTKFSFALDDKFRVEIGPSQVVFGCHGTNVLWAALFPDEPGEIVAASDGQGEHVRSVWLRFHPARVGELFPADTVAGQGDASLLPKARRLAAHRIRSCWQSNSRPVVPWKRWVTIIMDTTEAPRRMYGIDTDEGTVRYFPTKTRQPFDQATAPEAFDTVWEAFDREYAMFAIKPEVDWARLRDQYRPRAEKAEDIYELGEVLAEMLAHLEDLHVYVRVDGVYVPGYTRDRPLNAGREAASHLVGTLNDTRRDLAWAMTNDGIGYINVYKLSDETLPQTFDEVLGRMEDTKGLILDLRFNGGGSEPLGIEIAGRFLDRRRVYSLSQYRNGPKHTDLGPKHQRAAEPSGPWHYTGPVIVLQGQKTMSSAESFLLMLAQCPQVTTMGDRSAGSSGNPRRVQAGDRILVNLPRWIDMDPDGKPIDAVGIPPDVKIEASPEDLTDERDPVLAAALAHLRRPAEPEGTEPAVVLKRRPGAPTPTDRPRVVAVSPADGATDVEPVTEIRLRFDRPMDPLVGKLEWELAGGVDSGPAGVGGVRLRQAPRYVSETHEFVIPVVLSPGRHCLLVNRVFGGEEPSGFLSDDGVAAASYRWRFTVADFPKRTEAPKPRVVSVDPPTGSETAVYTPIRIGFDRP
ncbi:MAG: S41 family peptidase, partial [Planctomycetota bacterium]